MKDLISVIIPTYNTSKYILDALDSVYNQTISNFEVIVINDGSTDNTEDILNKYKKGKKNLKIINIENHGQGYARNLALKKAKGEYIMFLDSDDFISPITLEYSLKRIKKDKSDFVFFNWSRFNELEKKELKVNKKSFIEKNILKGKECMELLTMKPYYTVMNLYKKSFLNDNKLKYGEGYLYEDVIFWLKVVNAAKKVSIIKDNFYRIRVNETSVTVNDYDTKKHMDSFIAMLRESNKYLETNKKNNNSFYEYIFNRFLIYYNERVSDNKKKEFITAFVKEMKNASFSNNKNELVNNLYDYIFNKDVKEFVKLIEHENNLKNEKLNQIKNKNIVDEYKPLNFIENNSKKNILVFLTTYNSVIKYSNFVKQCDYNNNNYYLLFKNSKIKNNDCLIDYMYKKVHYITYTKLHYKNNIESKILRRFDSKIINNIVLNKTIKKIFNNKEFDLVYLEDFKEEKLFKKLSKENTVRKITFNKIGILENEEL